MLSQDITESLLAAMLQLVSILSHRPVCTMARG